MIPNIDHVVKICVLRTCWGEIFLWHMFSRPEFAHGFHFCGPLFFNLIASCLKTCSKPSAYSQPPYSSLMSGAISHTCCTYIPSRFVRPIDPPRRDPRFYRKDGVNSHQCKIKKPNEAKLQVQSSRTLWVTRLFFCFGESWPLFQLYVFNMEAMWMASKLMNQYVLTQATYGLWEIKQENVLCGVK